MGIGRYTPEIKKKKKKKKKKIKKKKKKKKKKKTFNKILSIKYIKFHQINK